MCGRFTLETSISEVAGIFDAAAPDELADLPARYNIAPTQPILVVRGAAREAGAGADGGSRELALVRWGLLPGWVEDPEDWPPLINARAETLDRKPAFEDAFRFRRCLVPADGFFEWRREGGGKQPYLVRARAEGPMTFAGLWERWVGPEGAVESCTIVTTDANELLRPIHDRMPAILDSTAGARWIDPHLRIPDALAGLLRPFPSESLIAYPVSRAVNRADAEGPACVEPLEDRDPWRGAPPPSESGGDDAEEGDDESPSGAEAEDPRSGQLELF